MVRKWILAGLAIGLLIVPQLGMAWGAKGHRIVGFIAWQHLTPEAKAGVEAILEGQTLAQVSTWPDEIKSDPEWSPRGQRPDPPADWKHKLNHSRWHYATVRNDRDLKNLPKANYPLSDGYLIPKLMDSESVLRNAHASKAEKKQALAFLVHMIGDLHQPLHVGNGEDRGGNEVKVQWFGRDTNLHSVWDTDLIQHQDLSYKEFSEFLLNVAEKSDLEAWKHGDYVDWAGESASLRTQAYRLGSNREPPRLSWNYAYDTKDLVAQRLTQAGVRLAAKLNDIFK